MTPVSASEASTAQLYFVDAPSSIPLNCAGCSQVRLLSFYCEELYYQRDYLPSLLECRQSI
eukprot:scaffold1490_cov121-Skeletonema_dohrnii-CCMP3373.AAC.5